MTVATPLQSHVERFSLLNAEHFQPTPEAEALLARSDSLADVCQQLNEAYRRGQPMVSDLVYDNIFIETLRAQEPEHPFLHSVEPEPLNLNLPVVKHAKPLLSTEKAYEVNDIDRYLQRVTKAAIEMGVDTETLRFRLTAKLDGIAAHDDGSRVVTRGDGLQGNNITKIVDQGVVMEAGRGWGRGELVCNQAFFDAYLGKGTQFDQDHARNFISGFVDSDTVKPHHRIALDAGAIHFVPFAILPERIVTAEELLNEWEGLFDEVIANNAYGTDGMVVEVTDAALREFMGATSHHERAVLAIKRQGETAISVIEDIRVTTGRTGRLIPTLLIKPVVLSGATISKATAHTAKNLLALGLGSGAVARFIRSGEVIPKLIEVLTPADSPMDITHCPSCGTEAEDDGEHKVCPNTTGCAAQAEARLRHWFHTLGNIDLFGPETIARLVEANITELPAIYAMTEEDFEELGFGPGQSANLVAQLERSLREPVMEWRWLAAFGIRHLGRGDARKLLNAFPLEALSDISAAKIESISGFGPKTSPQIAKTLCEMWPVISLMHSMGFALEKDSPASSSDSSIAGLSICFTGTMFKATRKEMEAQAAKLGAKVQSDVTGKTSLLVAGEKAGGKLEKAAKINAKAGREAVRVMTEDDYLALISA